MNKLMLIPVLAFSFGLSIAHADMKADREVVNEACKQDAVTAGCEGKTVGKGLMMCLQSYRKAHKDFKLSDACKDATKKVRKEKKVEKK
ncbi:MAG: hypothetical protein H7328_03865 [Bdellovibrio sp.]|nr:hypothetical protein [Bdellovibrio sp.]